MADDTPDTPTAEKPAPRRRGPARKTPSTPTTRKPRGSVNRADDGASVTVVVAKDAVAAPDERAVRAVRPRSTSRATTRPAATRKATATPRASNATLEPAATKRPATKATSTRKPAKRSKSTLDRATGAVGGRVVAAALGALAAAGATAAMLTLRGSSARNLGTTKKPIDISGSGDKGKGHATSVQGSAHQPDGTDSSASFRAGIADENTVPGKS